MELEWPRRSRGGRCLGAGVGDQLGAGAPGSAVGMQEVEQPGEKGRRLGTGAPSELGLIKEDPRGRDSSAVGLQEKQELRRKEEGG